MTSSISDSDPLVNHAPKSRIKKDLAMGLGISICILAVFCGLYLWKTHINNKRFNALIMNQDCLSLGSRISLELEQQARFLLSLVYENSPDSQTKFLQSNKRVHGLLRRLERTETELDYTIPQRIRLEFLKLKQISSHLDESASTILHLMNTDKREEAREMLRAFTKPILENEIHRQTLFFIDEGKENLEQARKEWRHQESMHAVVFNALVAVFFASILAVSTKVAKSILKTEHKILRESEEKYRAVFDNAHEGIFITDKDKRILDVNDQATSLLGYPKEELLTGNLGSILPLRDAGSPPPPPWEPGKYVGDAQRLRRKDGSFLWAEIDAGSFQLDGKQRGVIHVRDVTEKKESENEKEKLEAQLTQAQKMEAIATLAGGIAHDFNNLLTGIQGNASLMLMRLEASHPHCAMLQSIEKLVQSGARLTSQLLGYARKGKYEPKPINLNKVLEETSRTFGRTKKEIAIRRELANDLLTVEADVGQIEQVLLNLYVNAWQAMPGGGGLYLQTNNVTLDASFVKPFKVHAGSYVRITVADTGFGMDKMTQRRIFEPFFTTKARGTGSGLGLASAYGIIKNHGGFINVYSEKNRGTEFSIYLPASKKSVAQEKTLHEALLRGKETILLVDDEDMITDTGKELLKTLGYTVFVARSGEEAIQAYKQNGKKIDMVILDMIMPDMSGSDTYDRLKQVDPGVRVLLSSGYSVDGQASEIMNRGCNGFIQKPFDIMQLSQKVRQTIESIPA